MEPITTTVIVAAITAGVTLGVGDAYEGLKATLKRKFGNDSEVAKAVDNLEAKPDSTPRQGQLNEELDAVGADQDPDVRRAAQELREQIKAQPGGEARIQKIQNAVGENIAQAQDQGTATVNVNQTKE